MFVAYCVVGLTAISVATDRNRLAVATCLRVAGLLFLGGF
jgi:hypothetical protein